MRGPIDLAQWDEIDRAVRSGEMVIEQASIDVIYDNIDVRSMSSTSAQVEQIYHGRRLWLSLYDLRPPKDRAKALDVEKKKIQQIQSLLRWEASITTDIPQDQLEKLLHPDPKPGLVDLGVLTEPWIGYRDFKTDLTKDGLLQSRNGHVWHPYEPMVAVCTKHGVNHDPPVENCDCGIYAYDKPDHTELKSEGGIWGEVALYGDVFRCETGYRAEFAYPQSLFMKDAGTKAIRRLQAQLQTTYGIPVILVDKRQGETASEIIQRYIDAAIEDRWQA